MNRSRIILGLLVLVIGILGWAIWGLPDGDLHVWFLDVGQGDSILMETPLGEWIIDDGGPDDTVLARMGAIMPFYEHRIKVMFLSHPHADHINGLLGVLKRYEVESIVMTGVKYEYAGYEKFYHLAQERGVRIIFVDGSFDLRLGKIGFDLIYPERNIQGITFDNANNSSVVFRLVYGENRGFFSGDLEMEKEAELVKQVRNADVKSILDIASKNIAPPVLNLKADILKAGHHGSKTSNTEDFVKLIEPKFAVISCGVNNKFNHPFAGTVERFARLGATVYRTDLDGTVEASMDGKTIRMQVEGKI